MFHTHCSSWKFTLVNLLRVSWLSLSQALEFQAELFSERECMWMQNVCLRTRDAACSNMETLHFKFACVTWKRIISFQK